MPRDKCVNCGCVKYKHEFPLQQWTRKDKRRHCTFCVEQRVEAGTPLECSNCKLWKANAAFPDKQHHKNCINTRVCFSCKERRRCRGTCQALKTQEEFEYWQWEQAKWPSSQQGFCKECMTHGWWTCLQCRNKKPKEEFEKWKNKQTNNKRNHGKARCNGCVEENERAEQEIKRSNIEQVAMKKGKGTKRCSGCKESFEQEGHYTEWMWMLGETERKCMGCMRMKQNTTWM